jgi:5-hydroxyisourate hydrolase
MPGVSIHVVDVSRGIVAAGMRVELRHEGQLVAGGETSDKGTLEVGQRVAPGFYEAVFHVADWYHAQHVDLPEVPFLEVVTYRFGVSNPDQHYHLPFKCTPWGYSCFRGGA